MMPDDMPYIPEPRWAGILELNIGDAWRAVWVEGDTLPEGVPALFAYAEVLMGDKGYVTRPKGEEPWRTIETPVEKGTDPVAAVKNAAQLQTGAVAGKIVQLGFLECRATKLNPEYESGAISVQPVYLIAAKDMKDTPKDSPFERRRLPINEYAAAIRKRYPELSTYLALASEKFLVMKAKGEL